MTYSAADASTGTPRLRGRTPLRLSFVFLALAIIVIAIGVVVLVRGYTSTISGFERVSFDGRASTVRFHDGNYVGYVETPRLAEGNVQMRISAVGTGRTVTIKTYGQKANSTSSLTYSYHGRHGQAVFKFRITSAGRYTVQLASNDLPNGSFMAFGKSIAGTLVGGVLLVLSGAVLGLVFVILLIVGLVKRGNSKRESAFAYGGGGYGGPPPPGYGQQPPPGYAQQQPPPGYGQQPPPGYGQQPPTTG